MNDDWKGEHLLVVPRNPDAVRGVTQPAVHPATAKAKARRDEIVRLTGQGLNVDEIAEMLKLTPTTIRADAYRAGITVKLAGRA